MEFLLLLILLQFKHWYADFCIQTYDQTVKKGIYGDPVGLSHSLDHMSWTLVALVVFSFFHTIHPAAVHYPIDYLKVKFGIKDITKPRYWREFGLDQLAHQLTYVAIIWYILLR
jgi:hypothetical protein